VAIESVRERMMNMVLQEAAGTAFAGRRTARWIPVPGRAKVRTTLDLMKVRPVVKWAFTIFLFTIPFETFGNWGELAGISLSKAAGWLFLIVAFTQTRLCFRKPPPVFWAFAAYVAAYSISALLQDSSLRAEIWARNSTLIQSLILFWLSVNVLSVPGMARQFSIAIGASFGLLSVLQWTGVTAVETDLRVSALYANPNDFAGGLALALCIVAAAVLNPVASRRSKAVNVLIGALMVFALVNAASNGGLAALCVGLLAIMASSGSWKVRMRHTLVASLFLTSVYFAVGQTELANRRVSRALYENQLSDRDLINRETLSMLLEKPVFGWGGQENYYALGRRLGGFYLDTHNTFMNALTEVGLVGGIPFIGGILICLRHAWTARRGALGVLPFALTACLVTICVSSTWVNIKLFWLVLAFAAAPSASLCFPFLTSPVRQSATGPTCVLRR
jgi:O-antigen ligase